jgi:hypothetical protein
VRRRQSAAAAAPPEDPLARQEARARASGRTLRVLLRAERAHTGSAAEDHFRRAESQFFRCLRGMAAAGGAQQHSLDAVEYVFNPRLVAAFEAKRAEFDRRYGRGAGGHSTVLLFHGTPAPAAVVSIVATGFDMARVGSTTDAGFYGAGAYLSEMTDMSLGYAGRAGKLLLCRVLLGRPFLVAGAHPGQRARLHGRPCTPGYDSHVLDMAFSEVVIFNSAQILPCYILHLAPPGGAAAQQAAAHGGMLMMPPPPPLMGTLAGAMNMLAAMHGGGAVGSAAPPTGGGGGGGGGGGVGTTQLSSAASALPGGVAGLSSQGPSNAERAAMKAQRAAAAEKRQREVDAEADEMLRAAKASVASAAAARAEEADVARAIAASLQDAAAARPSR